MALQSAAAGDRLEPRPTLAQLVQTDVEFDQMIYDLLGNPALAETIATQRPHLRRSMGTVLEGDSYRRRAWSEHAEITRLILAGDANAAGFAAYDRADHAETQTEQRLLQEEPPC